MMMKNKSQDQIEDLFNLKFTPHNLPVQIHSKRG